MRARFVFASLACLVACAPTSSQRFSSHPVHAHAAQVTAPEQARADTVELCAATTEPPSAEHDCDDNVIGEAARPPADAAPAAAPQPSAEPLPAITFREPVPSSLAKDAAAVRYANLSEKACLAEIKKRDLAATRSKSAASGVAQSMRITGPFNGVKMRVPEAAFGQLDCRLVLALDDFTKVLVKHDVVAVRIDNFYRKGAKIAGRKKKSQHAFGLAADITSFELSDGTVLATPNWGATIGEVPCGPDAVMAAPTKSSVLVRNLVCEVARSGVFHTLLSPSFNADHQSHFHFDIKRDASSLSVR